MFEIFAIINPVYSTQIIVYKFNKYIRKEKVFLVTIGQHRRASNREQVV